MTDEAKAIEWRGIRLEPHSPGVWLSADRLWKVTRIAGDPHTVACLQLSIGLLIVDSGETAEEALEHLSVQANAVAEKLNEALEQASPPERTSGVISGADIKAARIAAKLSVTELALRLDTMASIINRLESETEPTLGLDGWLSLSKALPTLIRPKLLEELEGAIRKRESQVT